MSTPLRALIVEDSEDDCLLVKNELRRGGYDVTHRQVETGEAMSAALAQEQWDIVISDHRMPQFSSLAALKLCKQHECNIPFIVVSGSIGEELAVAAMKAGAHDYIMKDNLTRLVPAVERELRDAESRRQRQRAEQELEQCHHRTESILEAAGEGICGLDANGVINFINPRGAKLLGWEPVDLIGQSFHETIHYSRPDGAPFPKQDCSLCATLRDGLIHWMDAEVFWRKDHSAFPVEYMCVPMRKDATIVGAVLTFQDITERKGAEVALRDANCRLQSNLQELRQTQRRLVEQERLDALGRMASGVAHDFNNALSQMVGFTELLLTSPEKLQNTETVRDHLCKINDTGRDAARVVQRLREFYRPRRHTEPQKVVDLNRVVEESVSLTEPKWKHEQEIMGIAIRVQTDFQPGVSILADPAEMREALTNLIFNAVDAMPQGGLITIRTRRHEEHAVLEISDTGTGMTEEIRQRCFEPFFSTKGDAGTGLGLASVYGIVQRHGGEIRIHSQPGGGSTFSILLPGRSDQPARPVEKETPAVPKNHRLNILVVEDEPMVQGIEVEYLVADGHAVETAGDGCEGLSKFRAGRFDLVLVDRAMPKINGDQLTEAIKELVPNMPVILVTGFETTFGDNPDQQRRADLILTKPFSRATLRKAVGKAVAA
jgi:PAS domain S-box-containing protein